MRILLAAKHAPEGSRPIGGVQSWCRTVAAELRNRGHEAVTWGPEQPIPLGGFDLGIVANAQDTRQALRYCVKAINICHGIIPAERPADSTWTSRVLFTSEEVREYWGGKGDIVRQPIDTEFWSPADVPQTYLTRFSYRGGLAFISTVAKLLSLRYYHLRNATPAGVREVLRKSACVLATGRAALEAMACGVPVVLCDHRSAYQGPLMDLDVHGAMARNYSGRGGIVPTLQNVKSAVEGTREDLRGHVLEHHDARRIVDQLLEAA